MSDHVAFIRWNGHTFVTCDSDSEGAFKVWRQSPEDEKRRRVYYQDIVYDVCNQLDKMYGDKTQCGTVDGPSTDVQQRMRFLVKQLFDRCSIDTAFPPGTEGRDQAYGDALFRANMFCEKLKQQIKTSEFVTQLSTDMTYLCYCLAEMYHVKSHGVGEPSFGDCREGMCAEWHKLRQKAAVCQR